MLFNNINKYLLVFSTLLLVGGNTGFSSDNSDNQEVLNNKTIITDKTIINQNSDQDNNIKANIIEFNENEEGKNSIEYDANSSSNVTFGPWSQEQQNEEDKKEDEKIEEDEIDINTQHKEYDVENQEGKISNNYNIWKNANIKHSIIEKKNGDLQLNPKHDLQMNYNDDDMKGNNAKNTKKEWTIKDNIRMDKKGNLYLGPKYGENEVINPMKDKVCEWPDGKIRIGYDFVVPRHYHDYEDQKEDKKEEEKQYSDFDTQQLKHNEGKDCSYVYSGGSIYNNEREDNMTDKEKPYICRDSSIYDPQPNNYDYQPNNNNVSSGDFYSHSGSIYDSQPNNYNYQQTNNNVSSGDFYSYSGSIYNDQGSNQAKTGGQEYCSYPGHGRNHK